MKTYQITLPDEVAEFVTRVLAEKKWDSLDNLVAYGLLQVEAELDADADIDQEALRRAVQVGVDQAERGETVGLDLDATWSCAQKQLAEEQEVAHAPGDANSASR